MVAETLDRIGKSGCDNQPTLESLAELQNSFVRSVPFENQAMHESEQLLDISLAAVYQKVVQQKRGGLCFELNPFFCDLLNGLGYSSFTAACTMYDPSSGRPGPAGTHVTVIVNLPSDGQYLVDVANGLDLGSPVPLSGAYRTIGEVAPFGGETPSGDSLLTTEFSVGPLKDPDNPHSLALFAHTGGTDSVRFSFSPSERTRSSIQAGPELLFTQRDPGSIFRQKMLATLRTAEGRITLAGSKLITTAAGKRHTEEVAGRKAQLQVLREKFGLNYG